MTPVSVVASWRLWAVPLISACVAGYAAWFVQAVRIDNVKLESARHQAELVAQLEAARTQAMEAARAQEQAFNARLNEATHEHQQTLARARVQASAARAELDRLRDDLADPNRLSDLAGAAGGIRPDPARALLGECASAYLELAQRADEHAADVRLLLNSWPR
jgi:hypothetical protein